MTSVILEKLDEFLKEPRSPSGAKMVGNALGLFRASLEKSGQTQLTPSLLLDFDGFMRAEHPNWGDQTRAMTAGHLKSFLGWMKRQGIEVPEQQRDGLPRRARKKKDLVKPMDQQDMTDQPLDRGDFAAEPVETVYEPSVPAQSTQPQIHVHVPTAAPARATRAARAAAEPKTPAASTTFKRAFADAERIKVRKADDLGHERLIDEYPISVLQRTHGDVELFVLRQLAPRLGPGDYIVEGYNARGELMGHKRVPVGEPSVGGPVSIGLSAPASPLDRIVDRLNQIENGMRVQHNQPPKTMVEQAQEMAQLKTLFGGDQSAMLMYMLGQRPEAKGDPMILAELHSLKAQLEQAKMGPGPVGPGTAILPPMPLAQPSHDPVDYMGLAKLIETMRPAALPPPPAAPDPMAMFTGMVTAMSTMMASIMPKQSAGPSPVEEVLRQQVSDLKDEIRDMQQQPPRGLADIVGEMQLIKQIPELMGISAKDNAESSFVGVLHKFIDKFPSNAAALKELAQEVRRNEAQRNQPQQPQQQQLPSGDAPAVPPPEFVESISRLTSADNPVDRMTIVMESVWILGKQPDFKESVEHMIKLVQERQKPEAMAEVKGLLQNCVNAGMIGQDVAAQTGQDFDRNFETVAKYIDKLTGKAEAAAVNGNGAGKPVANAAPPEPESDDDSDESRPEA